MIHESKGAAASYRFAHGLTRQTLYGDLSSPRRERYHLRIGEAMEEIAPDEPEQIAHHFVQAGRSASPDKKRRYLILAADKASGAAAWEEAARHYGQALEQEGEIPQEDRAEFLRRRGEAQSGAGDWEGAVDSLGQAISLFDSLGERERAGWVAFSLRRLYGARGQFDKASEVVQQALTLLGDADSEIRSRLLAQAGFFRSAFGEVEEAERLLTQSAEMAARLENPAAIGFAAFIRGMHCLSYSRLAEAAESLQKGAEWSLTGNDLWTASLSSSFRRRMLFSLGDLAEAEGSPEEQERLARRAGNFLAFCETKWLSSIVACLHGDLERAEALAVEVLELIEASHAVSGEPGALINLAYIRFLRGRDHESFEEPLLRAIDVYDQMSAAPTDDPRPVLLLLRALSGRLDEARMTLPEFERYFRFEDPWTAGLGEARLTLAVALVVLREKELARSLYEPLKGWTESSEYVLTGLASIPQLVNRVLGMLADICDAPDEALAYFDTAIGQAREIGIRSELAEACYWCADSLLRDDTAANKERANDLLAEACEIWEQAGMPAHVKRASRLASATGR